MENKVIKSYQNFDNEILDLVKDALSKPGPAVITIDDIGNKIEYEDKYSSVYKPNIHIGQRKLMMNELQFLNNFIKEFKSKRKYFVIYAGGSPGHHMYELARYYPNVTFIIVDPSRHQSYVSDNLVVINNKFAKYTRQIYYEVNNKYVHDLINLDTLSRMLETNVRIFIIRDLCSSKLLLDIKTQLPENSEIFLWSDIRTDNAESGKFGFDDKLNRKDVKDKPSVTDGDILWNLVMQYNWLKELQPDVSMFKFRLPFYTDNIDNILEFMSEDIGKSDFDNATELNVLDNYNNKIILYPFGKIYIQPWQPKSSTESRLVIKKEDINNLVIYSATEYDAYFNYYNCIERPIRKHNNGTEFYKYGYCECNDCAIELDVLHKYLKYNFNHILKEFNIPKNYNLSEVIGNICIRLNYLLGTKLEMKDIHGINRYID